MVGDMKVCLIIPPSPFLMDERVFPSLGILRVASSLENQNVKVDLIDLSGVQNYLDVVSKYVSENDTLLYGITSTTPQFPAVCKIACLIKQKENVSITLGGPHATLVAAAVKGEDKRNVVGRAHHAMNDMTGRFDTIIAGDGEMIPHNVMFGGDIVDADDPNGKYFMTDYQYSSAPKEARSLIDLSSYHYKIEGHEATTLIAQLGCPFSCGFCGGRKSPMLRRIRSRPTSTIISEIRDLHTTYGYTGFMFYDDELNVSNSMIELMDSIYLLQKELNTEFRLRGFVKAELFTDEQAESMYKAGFRWLLTGFESGSPRILKNIQKKASLEDNTRAVEIARRHGLKVKALMSIGHPGESEYTINETKNWLLDVRPDDFDCTIITTYPGTPYYDDAVLTAPGIWTYTAKNGDKLHADEVDYTITADYYKGAPGGGYKAYVHTDHLTSSELVTLRDTLEDSVRHTLNIPFNQSAAAINYEHSMGQNIPQNILRSSKNDSKKRVYLNLVK